MMVMVVVMVSYLQSGDLNCRHFHGCIMAQASATHPSNTTRISSGTWGVASNTTRMSDGGSIALYVFVSGMENI